MTKTPASNTKHKGDNTKTKPTTTPEVDLEHTPIAPVVHAVTEITESAFLKEFREFINRGSIIDLAIGVAVGGALTTIVNSLVNDIVMPISSLLVGGLDFTTLSINIPNFFGADATAHIAIGNFIQNVVNFLVIAFTMFLLVRFINHLNRSKEEKDAKNAQAKAEHDAKVKAAQTTQVTKSVLAAQTKPQNPTNNS